LGEFYQHEHLTKDNFETALKVESNAKNRCITGRKGLQIFAGGKYRWIIPKKFKVVNYIFIRLI
jgi:hypothetical protein